MNGLSGIAATALLLAPAAAQCGPLWQSGGGIPGVEPVGVLFPGTVVATARWDPDGPGPLGPRLVIAGSFTAAFGTAADNIAWRDPATGQWHPLGTGTDDRVEALLARSNGDLIAGGRFTTAGGVGASRVARWDGSSWSALGSGTDGDVVALATAGNGDVVAAGTFTTAGGTPAARVARWNGSTWSALGAGPVGTPRALLVMPSGDLVAAGQSGFSATVERWNGSGWSALGWSVGGPSAPRSAQCMTVLPGGDLAVGGRFPLFNGVAASDVAVFDGSTWQATGYPAGPTVRGIAVLGNGDLAVARDDFSQSAVWRWDGGTWSVMGCGFEPGLPLWPQPPVIHTLGVAPGGDLVAGGSFDGLRCGRAFGTARWDGTEWRSFETAGPGGEVDAFATRPGGELIVAGRFNRAGDVPANRIAEWDGSSWSALGTGVTDGYPQPKINSVAVLPGGDVVAGGVFATAGGASASNIARWDGAAWSPIGSGFLGEVYRVAALPGGGIVASHYFSPHVSQWNGSAWVAIGSGTSDGALAFVTMPDGDLVAGGAFTVAGGNVVNRIARWDGAQWSGLGGGFDGTVSALALLKNGDLVAGGAFGSAGGVPAAGIARWDGSSWSPIGAGFANGQVRSIVVLPNGDLLAGGRFETVLGAPGDYVARWDGTSWSAVGQGADDIVSALAMLQSGEVAVGGEFVTLDGADSPYFGLLGTTCPALADPIATACIGPAGPVSLVADTLPWTGASFDSIASGFAAGALAVSLVGLTNPNVPLSTLSPTGLPGCDQLASADAVLLVVPQGGAASQSFAIPNSAAFAGVQLFHQFAQIGLGAQGQLVSLSSSNGLQLVVGTL